MDRRKFLNIGAGAVVAAGFGGLTASAKAADGLRRRAARYNVAVTWARKLEQDGRAVIVAPDNTCGIDTLTKDKNALKLFYQKGYEDGHGLAKRL